MQIDSIDKIVTRYFAAVTRIPFTYNGVRYEPKTLRVSPLLLRDYTCPPGCGGCCFKFTLDYLPFEDKPEGVKRRTIDFNGRQIEIWTDPQLANETSRCRHLQPKDGRCGIYPFRPFTCDFELIRTLHSEDPKIPNSLTQKLFGRGWSYPRVDGGKGALCEMTPVTEKSIAEVIRKLNRLKRWADHFGLDTWAPNLIKIVENGFLATARRPVIFKPKPRLGFGLFDL